MPKKKTEPRDPLMGTIETRVGKTKTTYRAIWSVDNRPQKKTFPTHDEACDHLDEMAIDVRRGGKAKAIDKTRIRFEDLAAEYLETRKTLSASTQGRERAAVKRLNETFARRPFSDIEKRDIQLWINDLQIDPSEDCARCGWLQTEEYDDNARCEDHAGIKMLTARTIRDYYDTFSAILRDAYMDRMPWAICPIGKRMHHLPKSDKRMICLTDDQLDHLLAVTAEQFPAHLVEIHLDAHTGLRQGELLGLHRNRYNPLRKTLLIDRALKRSSGNGAPIVGSTKTDRARTVALLPCCVELLNNHLACHDWDVIFPGETGKPQNTTNWRRRVWYPIRAAAGFEEMGLHFHDLRHTHCTSLLEAGWETKEVAERLGHASTQMTHDVYGHARVGRQAQLLEQLGIRAV